jgi:hypothetical protein
MAESPNVNNVNTSSHGLGAKGGANIAGTAIGDLIGKVDCERAKKLPPTIKAVEDVAPATVKEIGGPGEMGQELRKGMSDQIGAPIPGAGKGMEMGG